MANGQEVGKVFLGLHLNSKPIEQQANNMKGSLSRMFSGMGDEFGKSLSGSLGLALKAGGWAAVGAAVVTLGKKCVTLASDLQEVQNVVDTTFGDMSASIDAWAENAAAKFGLSEQMAKEFTGYYGAMAKAAGITGDKMYEMSTNLAGLAGDVASFYNMSQEEAYGKLQAVFSGETEPLRRIGIDMTQASLDAYALANGLGKTTAEMSSAEKTALRYHYVMSTLSDASGDWKDTLGGSFSNQVKYLKIQLQQLGTTIGELILPILTKFLIFLNTILKAVNQVANGIKALINRLKQILAPLAAIFSVVKSFFQNIASGIKKFFGIADSAVDDTGANLTALEDLMAGLAGSSDDAAESVGGVGDAASGAADQIKRSLMGFDQINKLMDQASSGGSGGGGVSSGSGSGGSGGTGSVDASGVFDDNFGKLEIPDSISFPAIDAKGPLNLSFSPISGLNNLKDTVTEKVADLFTNPVPATVPVLGSILLTLSSPATSATVKTWLLEKLGEIALEIPAVADVVVSLKSSLPDMQSYLESLKERLSAAAEFAVNATAMISLNLALPGFSAQTVTEFLQERIGKQVSEIPVTAAIELQMPEESALRKMAQTMADKIQEAFSSVEYEVGNTSVSESGHSHASGTAEPVDTTGEDVMYDALQPSPAMELFQNLIAAAFVPEVIVQAISNALSGGAATSPAFAFTAKLTDFEDDIDPFKKRTEGWKSAIESSSDDIPLKDKIIGSWKATLQSASDSIPARDKSIASTAVFKTKDYGGGYNKDSFGRIASTAVFKTKDYGTGYTKDSFGRFASTAVWKSQTYASGKKASDFTNWTSTAVWAKESLASGKSWSDFTNWNSTAVFKYWNDKLNSKPWSYADAYFDWYDGKSTGIQNRNGLGKPWAYADAYFDQYYGNDASKKYAALGGAFYGGSWHSIPQYAGGTANAHGSMFIAGEAGPEVVGHIGGRTEVLNRSQLASTMHSAVISGMGAALGNLAAWITPPLAMIGRSVSRSEEHLASMDSQMRSGATGGGPELMSLLRQIVTLIRDLDTNAYLDGADVTDHVVKHLNARTRATGVCELIV